MITALLAGRMRKQSKRSATMSWHGAYREEMTSIWTHSSRPGVGNLFPSKGHFDDHSIARWPYEETIQAERHHELARSVPRKFLFHRPPQIAGNGLYDSIWTHSKPSQNAIFGFIVLTSGKKLNDEQWVCGGELYLICLICWNMYLTPPPTKIKSSYVVRLFNFWDCTAFCSFRLVIFPHFGMDRWPLRYISVVLKLKILFCSSPRGPYEFGLQAGSGPRAGGSPPLV